jgi:hypothetical protein
MAKQVSAKAEQLPERKTKKLFVPAYWASKGRLVVCQPYDANGQRFDTAEKAEDSLAAVTKDRANSFVIALEAPAATLPDNDD